MTSTTSTTCTCGICGAVLVTDGVATWCPANRRHDTFPAAPPLASGTYADLAECVDFVAESYGDMRAEHRGEVARFGDSWPGAQLQLASMRRDLEALELELAGHPDRLSHLRSWLPPYFAHRVPMLARKEDAPPF